MRLVFLGPPGAGKGTQAVRLAERTGAARVATGDLLRAAVAEDTEIGRRAKASMDAGELVPDPLVLQLLRQRLCEPDARAGFLLDGFPRSTTQAEALDRILAEQSQRLDAVVALDVPDDEIVARLSNRWSCPACGRVYGDSGAPASVTCPVDDTPLVRRDDDRPEVIRKRLGVYRERTEPLVAYYREQGLLIRVDGLGTTEAVADRIAGALEKVGSGA